MPRLEGEDIISIHALREEGDASSWRAPLSPENFYPRPPRGGRLMVVLPPLCRCRFLSTPSARRATSPLSGALPPRLYFYPRPPRGGRHGAACSSQRPKAISIHALREEGDSSTPSITQPLPYFYPRPPRGGRPSRYAKNAGSSKFLSTPSARRATAKTETKSLFSNKLYNILHEFRRALIYNGSKSYPNHAK